MIERVFEPAVRYAREGAPITEVIAWAWQRSAKVLGGQPGFADTFLPAGRAPAKGELFANPDLARTLGHSRWQVFFRVTLPLARRGIFYGAMLCFTRGLGEFGATALVAGIIQSLISTQP